MTARQVLEVLEQLVTYCPNCKVPCDATQVVDEGRVITYVPACSKCQWELDTAPMWMDPTAF